MYVYLPVQFIFSFCSNYCLLTFCIFLNIFLDLLYILCHAVFLAIKTNKKKQKKTDLIDRSPEYFSPVHPVSKTHQRPCPEAK